MLSFAVICPHPPIIIPNIGGDEINKVKRTINAMEKLSEDFEMAKISTAVIISPHGHLDWHHMTINISLILNGNFLNFGNSSGMQFNNNIELSEKISELAKKSGIHIKKDSDPHLDHGTMVPLYFLAKNVPRLKIVPITYSLMDYEKHFNFGKSLYAAISESTENIAIIASGDLSHRLTSNAPSGFSKYGKEFDKTLIELLKNGKTGEIMNLDPNFIEKAGECGLRSIIVLLGALSFVKYQFEKISYEGPFGVGYLVGKFNLNVSPGE